MIKQIFTFVDLILSTFLNYCEFFFFFNGLPRQKHFEFNNQLKGSLQSGETYKLH